MTDSATTTPPDVSAAVDALVGRHDGDMRAVVDKLFGENFSLREARRVLDEQITDLTGKVPVDGALVLNGDDVAAWTGYTALGNIEDVTNGMAERDTLKASLTQHERQQLWTKAAEAHGYKAAVLMKLAGTDLNLEMRTVTGDNESTYQVAYVLPNEGEAVKLDVYAAKQWPDFMPALQVTDGQQQSGVKFVSQQGSGNKKATNVAKTYIAKTYQRNDSKES